MTKFGASPALYSLHKTSLACNTFSTLINPFISTENVMISGLMPSLSILSSNCTDSSSNPFLHNISTNVVYAMHPTVTPFIFILSRRLLATSNFVCLQKPLKRDP
uniref:Uncharacterized protein n=1 Tax=Rhizophora mucronata TaxID=61149 RepID=A0A2P2QNQ2_RHIMU